METLTRDLQINLIMDNPNPIIEFFNKICNDLFIVECCIYGGGKEFIYYNSNKEWIFFRDDNNGKFWCNHETYWHIIEIKFNINHSQIKLITKFLVENVLNKKVDNPLISTGVTNTKITNGLNNSIADPRNTRTTWGEKVEIFIKNNDLIL